MVLQRLFLILVMLPGLVQGFMLGQLMLNYHPVVMPVVSSGYVMARAQVVGPNGGPILVKVRSSGAGGQSSTVEVEEIGEAYAGGPLDGVYVLSGSAYRDVLRQLASLRALHPERMARAEFLPAAQLASGLALADGRYTPGIDLPDHIKTVVVWGRQDRLSPGTEANIILMAPFQLDAGTSLDEDVSSLLINPDGSIRSMAHGSGVGGDNFDVESFTWRTAFYAQPGSTEQSDQRVDGNHDTIFGPVPTAILEQLGWFGTMYAVTNADGHYYINSPMLCMRNAFGAYLLPGMDTNLILTVPTVPFNPNRLGIPPYFELRDVYAACSDSARPYRMDFLIDVLWLVGELHLSNTPGGAAIPVGSSVSYEGQDRSGEPTVRVWDYDGDGEADKAVLAHKRTITDPDTGESFVIPELADDGGYQAVYFSSGDRVPPPKEEDITDPARHVPDLWRLADRTLDGRPTGLLTEISEDALRHTDVYIFRESTGELLVEVSGLPEGPYAGRASRIENNAYLWHTLLRGRESVRNNFAAYGTSSGSRSPTNEDAFRERSEELGFSSRYQSRDADMPAPGEMLHVVAINRVTGYTGSVRFELGAANSPGGAQQRVPRLELLPPNVRVWAQRLAEIEAGLTVGEQREYLISHEGAHTANDLIVGLYTDWRTADGSPLPNALGQVRGADFGLTGRLAKVRDGQLVQVTAGQALDSSITLEDALAAGSQGAVAEFPIGPGQNLQLLRLPNTETGGNEHYYVNLFGRALNKEVCSHCQYDQAGLHPTLAGRPNHFAPVFVPRYDQESTDNKRQQSGTSNSEADYVWLLRPEYRFSQLDFTVSEILGEYRDVEGATRDRNLLALDFPIFGGAYDLLEILYGLVLPTETALPVFDGVREYVLALGENELRITSTASGDLIFNDLGFLSQLALEDYLSLRLFLKHDPENILWEWAFSTGGFLISKRLPQEEVYLRQDRQEVPDMEEDMPHYWLLGGVRLRMRYAPEDTEGLVRIVWQIEPENDAVGAGRFCTDWTAREGALCANVVTQTFEGGALRLLAQNDFSVFWEPADWVVEEDGRIYRGSVSLHYAAEDEPEVYHFSIGNRQIMPRGDEQPAMRGNDVAMLEEMLWQLGISPQWGWPGTSGTRIDSIRRTYVRERQTLDCGRDLHKPRDQYSPGYVPRGPQSGWPLGDICGRREASIEAMVRRLQGRHSTPVSQGLAGPITMSNQSGVVDAQTLGWLENAWRQYAEASEQHPRGRINSTDSEVDIWLQDAVGVWQGDLPHRDANGVFYVPGTYTDERHRNVRALAGQVEEEAESGSADVDDRVSLLRQWVLREARTHWGAGDPVTAFRITEGGADEYGSMSFNQVLYQYRYSDEPCTVHGGVALNYFDPRENMMGFSVHTSGREMAGDESCGGSFWRAFVPTSEVVEGTQRPGRLAARRDRGDLRGFRHGDGEIVNTVQQVWEDDYELLAKGVGLYNGGGHAMTGGRAWSNILREFQPSTDSSGQGNRGANCYSCRYSTVIRNGNDAYGLPYRTYIWYGGEWADDAAAEDEEGNSIPHPQAGQEWCFAYGEGEWINPEDHPVTGEPMRYIDYFDQAETIEARRISCG